MNIGDEVLAPRERADQTGNGRPRRRTRPSGGELRIYLGAAPPGVGKTFSMRRGSTSQARTRHRRGRGRRRDPRPQEDRRAARRDRDRRAAVHRVPRRAVSRTRRARGHRPAPGGGAGRRTGPHQHSGQRERQALAGRRRTTRRRDRRHLDGQRPAPGEPQRRGHPDHRNRATGEGPPRRGGARGRSDRVGRHHPRKHCGAGYPTEMCTAPPSVSMRRCPTTSGAEI